MAEDELVIEHLTAADWPAVREIYRAGIATGNATLETDVPSWEHWDSAHRLEARLVARLGGEVVGFFALSPYSGRAVYAGVAWESVYVAPSRQGQGVGRRLLGAGIAAATSAGCWTLLAGVLADNAGSLAVHERVGFRRVGVNRSIGRDRHGRWRDVVQLEWRSEG